MFFEINDKLGLKFIEQEIRMVPEFAALLSDKELGIKAFDFIVKCYRYNSPYRALPEEQRIKLCAEAAFKQKGKVHALDSDKVARAIDVFNELQFDSDWEEYYAVETKCTEIAKFIKETPLAEEAMDMLDKAGRTLKTYNDIKRDLKEIVFTKVERAEDNMSIRAGKRLSFAEEKFLPEELRNNS